MSQKQVDISVIIGFKDWGVERLLLSVASIRDSFGDKNGEVIVSDFGSEAFVEGELKELVESLGGVYIRTETDGGWSRSRAVNKGYSAAKGTVVVATDADMLFTPKSMETIANEVLADPTTAVVLQCRDLPEGYGYESISANSTSFEELHRVSQIRPRWGMGGMFAAHRNVIAAVGGYDNRMHTYGGEDLDLAVRVRRSGRRIRWIENDQVRMYHIWHEPTIKSVEEDKAARKAVAANRAILKSDPTWKRNVANGEFEDLRISWEKEALSVVDSSGDFLEYPKAAFLLVSPVRMTIREDISRLVAKQLDTTKRALVGQIVAFEPPKSRTAPNWEVEYRLPVLAFDSKLAPLVSRYFANDRWDVMGAARRLQAAGVKIGAAPEIFGVIPNTPENSKIARSNAWEWKSAEGLLPKAPGPWATSEVTKNLSIDVLAGMSSGIDIRIAFSTGQETDQVKRVTELATEWVSSKNLLTGAIEFEAIILSASEADVAIVRDLNETIGAEVSQIPFVEALAAIERLSPSNCLVNHLEDLRLQRDDQSSAIEVSWIEDPDEIDEAMLTETRTIGGDLFDLKNGQFHARLWLAPGPVMDLAGNVIRPLNQSSYFEKWNTGLLGSAPVEALLTLGGRLQK